MKLGRLPHDPDRVAALPAMSHKAMSAMAPPPTLDRSALHYQPAMDHNDVIGDCTAAGLANALDAWTATKGYTSRVDPDKVLRFYAATIGHPEYTFDQLTQTDGAYMVDVLSYQARHGFDTCEGLIPHTADYARVDLGFRSYLALGMSHLGCCYVGVDLTDHDMTSDVWDDDGSDRSSVVGGHCIVLWDYAGLDDNSIVRIATWGTLKRATWRWLDRRLQEAYVLAWRQETQSLQEWLDLEAGPFGWLA